MRWVYLNLRKLRLAGQKPANNPKLLPLIHHFFLSQLKGTRPLWNCFPGFAYRNRSVHPYILPELPLTLSASWCPQHGKAAGGPVAENRSSGSAGGQRGYGMGTPTVGVAPLPCFPGNPGRTERRKGFGALQRRAGSQGKGAVQGSYHRHPHLHSRSPPGKYSHAGQHVLSE